MGAHTSARLGENYHAKQQGPALGPQGGFMVMQGCTRLGDLVIPQKKGEAQGSKGVRCPYSARPVGTEWYSCVLRVQRVACMRHCTCGSLVVSLKEAIMDNCADV